MARFIEARVIQKVATEAEWLQTTLPLYQGEIAFVSDKNNFKLNTQPQAKTFAELEYYYKGDILGGVLPTDDLVNKPNGVYRATISGTYSGVVVKEGYYTLLRKSSGVWSLESEVKMPSVDVDGSIAIGQTTKAVNGDTIYKFLYKDVDSNILYFTDKENKIYGLVNDKGEFNIKLTEDSKKDISGVYEDLNINNTVLVVNGDKVFLDLNEKPLDNLIDEDLKINDIVLKHKTISFDITAVGRATNKETDDAIKVHLVNEGVTHPKVLYFENGLFGYKYWMALTPTFGSIAVQEAPAYYENPHVLCSNDGINWIEPTGKPLDVTAPFSFTNAGYPFWSDTHLVHKGDGFLYCYYRGVNMPKGYVKNDETTGIYSTVIVERKTNDGLTWSDRKIIATTEDEGVDNESGLFSPALDFYKNVLNYYDLISDTDLHPLPPQKNQNINFVHRRNFENGVLTPYSKNNIINFKNRPWGETKNPWHLDYVNIDGLHFLLLNIGLSGLSMGNDLYLAYSYDGWNFTVFEGAIHTSNTYRSSLTFKEKKNDKIIFDIFRSDTSNGTIDVIEVVINN